jgi:hypothetical protein
MVTVTNFLERQRKDGSSFVVLEITGGLELVQSSSSGNFYATVRKSTIPSTFSVEIAKSLIGTQLPGSIVRVEVDGYDFTNIRTGEVMQLHHSYAYRPEGSMELIGQTQISEIAMA